MDRQAIYTIILAAMRFYREKLREAVWEAEYGAALRECVKRTVAMRMPAAGERVVGMYS